MTSPPCPSTGPARRPPSSDRRTETAPGAVPDVTPTTRADPRADHRADRRGLRHLHGPGREGVGLPSRLRQPAGLQPRRERRHRVVDGTGRRWRARAGCPLHLRPGRSRAGPGRTCRSSSGPWRPLPRRSWPPGCRAAATPTRSSWCGRSRTAGVKPRSPSGSPCPTASPRTSGPLLRRAAWTPSAKSSA